MGLVKKDELESEKEVEEDAPVVKKLKEIDDQYRDIELEFELAVQKLQLEFAKRQQPLLEQRKKVLTEVDGEGPATGTPACAGFWMQAMQNHPAFEDLIQEHDEPVLEFLQDITTKPVKDLDANAGFELTFHFAPNPYFENTQLSKVYLTERQSIYNGDISATEIQADIVKWFPGKDVTVEVVSKKTKGGGAKKSKAKKGKEEARPSFFRDFFRNLKQGEPLPEDARDQARALAEAESDDEENDDEELCSYLLETDLECGQSLRDAIIPWGIRWYTGEAAPEEEDDDDYDEEEEEDDEDYEDDEEEDDEPPKGKGRGGKGPKKGKGKAGQQEECKQQ